jgi:membrane protease YdiL (CAAX protease family)
LFVAGLGLWVFRQWLGDLRSARAGTPHPQSWPGAAPCSWTAILIAVAGSLILLGLETGGEYQLGISGQQKNISVLFLLAMVSAAFYEELIFRGFFVITGRGRAALVAGILGFSLLFALLHPFLWDWKSPGGLVFDFSLKAWWSTALVFASSLWFYSVRFFPLNPRHSLIPCIAAHLAKNLGVFAIKLAQGHVTSWW